MGPGRSVRDGLPSLADCGDGGLDGSGPQLDVGDVMRFIHAAQSGELTRAKITPREDTYTPKMILSLSAYFDAMLDQSAANSLLSGPPCPMIYHSLSVYLPSLT